MIRNGCVIALFCSLTIVAWCQESTSVDEPKEPVISRLEPKQPTEAIKTFTVLDGFRMELIAHEPMLRDPVSIAYDANGTMYAVEMTAYPHPERATDQAFGRVRQLIDDDGDGDFDSSHVFVDKLSTPTSVICWKGGVFVLAPPDLWYCKDTNGDHQADVRKKIFTGFGISNAEQLANGLKWGIDNKICGTVSHSGGSIRPANDENAKPISISDRDFRFDPVTGEFEPLTWASSRWGHSFDDAYNRFVCQNTGPARHVVLPLRYLARNPNLAVDAVYQSLAKEGGTEPVYRTSPPEPWRLVRAFRRQSLGKPANPGEINATGYFTASCGITIYRGNAYPAKYRGNLFVGDAAGNLVHRRTLKESGVTFDSQRADEKAEFVASRDNFFRPVNFVNAPDGTLHVVDMYREVVEGPSWVPDDLKKKGLVDVHGASDRGRIYRLAPPDFKTPSRPQLGKATTAELARHLENANSWWRETAQRLLVERQDKAAVEPLRNMLRGSFVAADVSLPGKSEVSRLQLRMLGRLHAMWTLDGLDALRDDDLLVALSDDFGIVREHAIRAAESRLNNSEMLLERVLSLHRDDTPRVRFQLALTLGEVSDPRAAECLARIAVRDIRDPWTQTSVLSSVDDNAPHVFETLLSVPSITRRDAGIAALKKIAFIIGARNKVKEVEQTLSSIANSEYAKKAPDLQIGLIVNLLKGGNHHASVSKLAAQLMPHARRTATNQDATTDQRADAIALLGLDKPRSAQQILTPLLDTRQPRQIQLSAVGTLAKFAQPNIATLLIGKWNSTTPAVRTEVVETLLSRRDWIKTLLDAIQHNRIPSGEISLARRNRLLNHDDETIRKRAATLLSDDALGTRKDVIAAYRPVLSLEGDADRGKRVFLRECIACHRFGKQGHDVGPNLSDYGRKRLPPESLMAQILDPNREVSSNYISYTVVLEDGRVINGLIAAQTPSSITLKRDQNVTVTILRKDIEEIKSSAKSLMPEGLEKKINHQEMADLLEFLSAVNQRI